MVPHGLCGWLKKSFPEKLKINVDPNNKELARRFRVARKRLPPEKTWESYYGVHLTYADQIMLEELFRRYAIGGETKSDKLRLLIRAVYDA